MTRIRRMFRRLTWISLIFLSWACAETSAPPMRAAIGVSLRVAGDEALASDVVSMTARLDAADGRSQTQVLAVTPGSSVELVFDGVSAGVATIEIVLSDSEGAALYRGEGSVDVKDGRESTALITVYPLDSPSILAVTFPNGGELLAQGAAVPISWESDAGGTVRIDLLRGTTVYQTLTANTLNDGDYSWTVANCDEATDYRLQITANELTSLYDTSDAVFSIADAPNYTLEVTSPNGGEVLSSGQTVSLTWNSNAGGTVRIDLLRGTTVYQTLTANTLNDGDYSWTVANCDEATDYRLQITANELTSLYDTSDAVFSIADAPNYTLEVTSPNGGEDLSSGQTVSLTWNSNAGGTVRIDLLQGSGLCQSVTANTANDGYYSWAIEGCGSASNYRIQISSNELSDLYDLSDSYFSLSQAPKTLQVRSPNGGEDLQSADTATISWESNAGGTVGIELLKGSSVCQTIAASTANDGAYSWTIDDCSDGTNYRIRITSKSDSSLSDVSDGYFSIQSPSGGGVTVTAPNGGETYGQFDSFPVRWVSSDGGLVYIRLFRGGSLVRTIDVTENDGSTTVTAGGVGAGSDYQIEVALADPPFDSDRSDGYFTLR